MWTSPGASASFFLHSCAAGSSKEPGFQNPAIFGTVESAFTPRNPLLSRWDLRRSPFLYAIFASGGKKMCHQGRRLVNGLRFLRKRSIWNEKAIWIAKHSEKLISLRYWERPLDLNVIVSRFFSLQDRAHQSSTFVILSSDSNTVSSLFSSVSLINLQFGRSSSIDLCQ